jgi:tetratricopeptide (TPR) repeat protein
MRRLNIKLLSILALSTIVLCAGVYFVHAWQLDSNIDSLFHEAKQAQAEKNNQRAMELYRRYLAHAPANSPFIAEGRCNLAVVADDMAQESGGKISALRMAYALLKDANIADPENPEVKRRLINYYLIDRGSPNALKLADELIRELLKDSPDDVDLHMRLAASQQGRSRDQEAIQTLARVVGYNLATDEFQSSKALDATTLEAYLQLAQLLSSQKTDKLDAAKKIVDKLVSINPDEYKAHEYRARYWRWRLQQDTAEADHDTIRGWIEEDLAAARKLSPNNGQVLMASADFATEQEKYEEAEKYLREAVDHYDNKFVIYAKLADALLRQGKRDEALVEIERGRVEMPDHAVLLRVQADLQLDSNQIEEAEKTIEKLTEVLEKQQLGTREDDAASRYYLQYLKARVSFHKRDWVAARRQLERVRPLMATSKDVVRRINDYLSVCYQQLGESDRIAENTLQGVLREVNQLMTSGNINAATELMRRLEEQLGRQRFLSVPVFRTTWVNLLVNKAAAAPTTDDDRWEQVDELLEDLKNVKEFEGVEKIVTEANILYLKGQKADAGRMLQEAVRGDYKNDVRVWTAWINMFQKERPEETLKQIDLAQEALGDNVIVRLLRIAHLLSQTDKKPAAEMAAELATLGENTANYSPEDRSRLLQGLATAHLRLGDTATALRMYQEIAKGNKNDPTIQMQIFNLALASGNDEAMDVSLTAIGELLGTQSAQHKQMEAARIVSRVDRKKVDAAKLQEAKDLIADAKKKRPRWHELARLEGDIALVERRADDALAHFEEAVELGSRNIRVLRQLAALLHAAGRHDDALAKLALLGENEKAGLTRIEADSHSLTDNPERALALAKKAIQDDKDNWNNRIWYGQLLARTGKHPEAEEQFRRAVELNPEEAGAWVILVAHLVQNEKKDEAIQVTRRAEAALSEDVAAGVLAQCYELLKDMSRAEKYYRQFHQIDPESTQSNRILAQFYLRSGQLQTAQEYIANILRKPSTEADQNVFWARRVLAELKSKDGTYRDTLLALKLLEANQLEGKEQPADKRLRAYLLGRRPERASRLEAVRLFEELRASKQLAEADLFALANLHLLTGNFEKFSAVMQSLPLNKNQAYLATYVDALVRHDMLDQAGPLLRQLETLDSSAPSAIALRARLLHKHDKTNEAVKLLKTLVPDTLDVNKLGLLPEVAQLMEDFGHADEAALLYRRFEREHPAGVLAHAAFLGRQGDLDQAFQLLSAAKNKLAIAAVIQNGLTILQAHSQKDKQQKIDAKYFQALESWFAQAESKEPNSLRVAVLRPHLFTLQERHDKSMELYEQLIAREDLPPAQRAMFLNNLAYMNTIRGQKLAESREMIDEAIEIMGPNSDLLDTRAVTLLGVDNQKAIEDLNTAIAESPDAIKYFHLALVELDSNNLGSARTALAQANEKGFDIDALDPAEREQHNRLVEALKKKPKQQTGLKPAA